jgi:hypothetical protein
MYIEHPEYLPYTCLVAGCLFRAEKLDLLKVFSHSFLISLFLS